MKYVIDEKLVNAILGYLGSKPYIEVANLIQGMNGMTVYEGKTIQNGSSPDSALKTVVAEKAKKYQETSGPPDVLNVPASRFIKK